MPFAYPLTFSPRHGPWGYTDYTTYKDWLRDEFVFRCVYCLFRETWYPDGHASFGVDHIVPKSEALILALAYGNLTYACNRCNSRKLALRLLDPRQNPFGTHLRVNPDGTIDWLTVEGEVLILALGLNEPDRVVWRKRYLDIYAEYHKPERQGDEYVRRRYVEAFSFPLSIPDLRDKKLSNGGNELPDGAKQSYFVQHGAEHSTKQYLEHPSHLVK